MPEKSQEFPAELVRALGPLPRAGPGGPWRVRGIAVLQALGALLGLYALLGDLTLAPLDALSCVPLAGVGLVPWLAFGVWRGDRRAIARMQWVLAAQIPWLNLHPLGVHYDLYFVFACILRIGNADEPLELGIGTAMNAYRGTTPDSAFLGVNVAALALFFLFRSASRSWRPQPGARPG